MEPSHSEQQAGGASVAPAAAAHPSSTSTTSSNLNFKLKYPILQLSAFYSSSSSSSSATDGNGNDDADGIRLLAVTNGDRADVYELEAGSETGGGGGGARLFCKTTTMKTSNAMRETGTGGKNHLSSVAVADVPAAEQHEEKGEMAAKGAAVINKDGTQTSEKSSKRSPLVDGDSTGAGEEAKSKLVRHVKLGVAPVRVVSTTTPSSFGDRDETKEEEVELGVVTVNEDKQLRLDRLEPLSSPSSASSAFGETATVVVMETEPIYTHTLIKKAAYVSLEADAGDGGSVLVSDKVGDLFEYPISSSSASADRSVVVAERPDATALAGDPSLNPDARLLAGHVSTLTAHLIASTPVQSSDGSTISGTSSSSSSYHRWLISADRDEHVRISRYPDTHVIHRFLHGHRRFVGALALATRYRAAGTSSSTSTPTPTLLLSAGGDDQILIWDLEAATSRDDDDSTAACPPSSQFLVTSVDIVAAVKPHRRVRAPMRRIPPGRQLPVGAAAAAVEEPSSSSSSSTATATDEFDRPAPGHALPLGQGICITKLEVVPHVIAHPDSHRQVVFLSQGCSALFAFDLDEATAASSADVGRRPQPLVKAFPLPAPVLDFVSLPTSVMGSAAATQQQQHILVSTDPAWKHRLDGGRAFDPPKLQPISRVHKKKLQKAEQADEERDGQAPPSQVAGDASSEEGYSVQDVESMRENGLVVVAIDADGAVSRLGSCEMYKEVKAD